MPSETYDGVKREQIKSETVTRIYGRLLGDADQLGLADRGAGDSRFPVQWCLCVEHSPDSPCICPPLIVWVDRLDVVAHGETDHKDHSGASLSYIDLRNDAQLLLERVQPLSTAAVKRIAALSPRDVDRLLGLSTTLAGLPLEGTRTIAREFGPDPDPEYYLWLLVFGGRDYSDVFDPIDWQQFVKDYGRGHH
jgi:hypothetical protein